MCICEGISVDSVQETGNGPMIWEGAFKEKNGEGKRTYADRLIY